MILKIKQFKHLLNQTHKIKLHSKIIKILFENRHYIKNVFSNLQGLYGVTHMGITCIDPSSELIVFSTTPNIEYNLIHQNLWMNDHNFIPNIAHKNSLLWWDNQNDQIEKIKLKNNRFTLGMTICRPIGNFLFLYSFATDEKLEELRSFYFDNVFNLIDLGDYFYKSIRDLYGMYNLKYTPPKLNEFNSKAPEINIKPFLRLL